MKSQPHLHKIVVPGNHDLILARQQDARDLLAPVTLLSDSEVTIHGVRFYGVGWGSKPAIPAGVDVLISHTPPFGVLDNGLGSRELREAVLAARPTVHVFGHIHGCRGHQTLGVTHFYNAVIDARAPKTALAASSHRVTLPTARPWVHELEK